MIYFINYEITNSGRITNFNVVDQSPDYDTPHMEEIKEQLIVEYILKIA